MLKVLFKLLVAFISGIIQGAGDIGNSLKDDMFK